MNINIEDNFSDMKERFLYFDTGDQFQGGIEGFISKGKIIMDFFNKLNLKKSVHLLIIYPYIFAQMDV